MAESAPNLAEKKHLELSDFEHLVNEKFVISLQGVEQTIEAELIQAKHINSDTSIDREPFCLDFKLPAGSQLGQHIYQVDNATIGVTLDLFLIPYKGDETGWYMTTQFN